MGTPAHGTPLPGGLAQGTTPSAPAPAPAGGTPHHAPAYRAPEPAYGGDPHYQGSAAAPGAAAPGADAYTSPAPAPVPASASAAGTGGQGSGGHWQPYDPWAAPLQQTGAAPQDRRRGRRGGLVRVALVALLAGLLGGALGSHLERDGGTDIKLPQAGVEPKERDPGSVAGIAASALPSVVTMHVRGDEEQGTGTGFILDKQGHILTNNHVVEPAGADGDISVTFSGGQTARGTVVGRDTGYDLAVVKVSGVSGLRPLALGNSDNVQVGDPVVAIGAPFDLANTVTSGIISAKERPITTAGDGKGGGSDVSYVDALQTDAPINPGNSGGPLVDGKARVIGINSAIRSADDGQSLEGGQSGSIGLGFAIPVNQAKRVAEELINTGAATHPVIGVTLDMDYTGDGARVGDQGNTGGAAVEHGGPADRAGIRPGDVITRVNGLRIHSGEELIVKIRAHRPGDRLDLTLERGGPVEGDGRDPEDEGRQQKVTLVLGAAKGN
nr:trypsin-like peptidase domain-containing protein [Streptomyces sulfonofaciens]